MIEDEQNQTNRRFLTAAEDGDVSIMRFLLEEGANINYAEPKHNNTALRLAVDKNRIAAVTLLLSSGADANCKNSFGYTPLINAVQQGNIEIAKLLISHGASLNEQDSMRETALLYAIGKDDAVMVSLLVDHGASLELSNRLGEKPFEYAKVRNQVNVIQYFESLSDQKRLEALIQQQEVKVTLYF